VNDESIERLRRGTGGSIRQVRRRIEAIERLGAHAPGQRYGENLAGEREVEFAVLGLRQGIGDRFVGEGRGEQHRAVRFLGPEVAEDIGGRGGALVEVAPRIADMHDAR
jgi:hypothetical protein